MIIKINDKYMIKSINIILSVFKLNIYIFYLACYLYFKWKENNLLTEDNFIFILNSCTKISIFYNMEYDFKINSNDYYLKSKWDKIINKFCIKYKITKPSKYELKNFLISFLGKIDYKLYIDYPKLTKNDIIKLSNNDIEKFCNKSFYKI